MAVKYNNYGQAVSDIIKYKKWWHDADAAGDDAAKTNAQNQANAAYKYLRDNGYKNEANILNSSNYTASKKWATDGKIQTRPYLYSLGKKYGMSNSDVDKLISYDDLTGNISLDGKNIGSADMVVDGVSYWNDTKALDNAFADYVDRTGTTRSTPSMVNQENENLFKKYNQEYEDLKNTNPFTTDEAKAILSKYSLAGLQGRDNAVASGSATNGGNIDSYAAANAMRQQASLVNQGQMAVLEAHQQKLDHARALLSDMGVNIDRVFNEDETAKNNEAARLSEQASVTGYVPRQWQYSDNPYFNSDGTLNEIYMSDDFDNTGGFTTIINNAREKLNESTDPTERANLQATINYATQAKAYKTLSNPKYAPYAHEVEGITEKPTLARDEMNTNANVALQTLATDASLQKYGIDADMAMSEADNQTDIMLQAMKNEVAAAKASSGGKSSSSSGSRSGSSSKTLDLSTNMKDFIKKVNDYAIENVGFKVLDSKGNRLNGVDDEFLANRLRLAENLSETELRSFNDYWGIPNGVNDTVKTDPHY